ncbi:MAG: 30S ribosome-binding factor RbfA [Metamycoplasmataceae bacterium]
MNEITRRKKESNYQQFIAEIISKHLKNTNISKVTTVVDVALTNDNSQLKVFVLFSEREDHFLKELNAAKGYIRTQLANHIDSRKTPEIIFEIDTVSKNAEKIEKILSSLKK